jgi:hypothetical protein
MRKFITLTIAAVFAAGLFPMAPAAGAFADIDGHWGEEYMAIMIGAGVIAGDGNGNAMPDKAIERYEAAIMLARAFGLNTLTLGDAVTGNYTDITAGSPFVEEYLNNIIAAGFMAGSGGKFDPQRGIPREEAFTALRNAFGFPKAPETFDSAFPDFDEVPLWAQDSVLAMEAAGMINGKNGLIAPSDSITRAEFAALLSRGIGVFIDSDTGFEGAEKVRAFIRKPGLTAENLTVEYLTVAQGVSGGGVTLDGCDIGSLYVFGGGTDSIRLINTNVTELVINTAVTGGVRVFVDENSLVELVVIYSEGAVLDVEGEVLDVTDHTDNGDNG